MTTDIDEGRISQALHELVPEPRSRPDRFEKVAVRARRNARRRRAVSGLAVAVAVGAFGYLITPSGDDVAVVPATSEMSVVGCTPWPPPTSGVVDLTPAEKDPVSGEITYPVILSPPVDPGVAAICDQLVPLVARNPGLADDPRALATAVYAAVKQMYQRPGDDGKVFGGIFAGETIREDDAGRWTTQLPGHPCLGRDGETGIGEAVYQGRNAAVRMRVHRDGCWAWAEVTLVEAGSR
jgi:hypothetical protein